MKLLSFIADGRASFGAFKDDGIVDLGKRMAPATTLRQMLEAHRLAEAAKLVAAVAPDHPLDEITFAPVIPDPGKIICVGLNYRDHVAETGRTVTEKPALFARFSCSQVGHLQPIVKPKVSDDFDYEGELALVIGKEGRHIPAGRALDHVAGYACYNEGSVRDWQRHTSQFLSGKTFADSGSFSTASFSRSAERIVSPARAARSSASTAMALSRSGSSGSSRSMLRLSGRGGRVTPSSAG